MEQLTAEKRQEIKDIISGISADMRALKEIIDEYFYNAENIMQRLEDNIGIDEAMASLNEVHNLLLTTQEQLFEL